MNAGRCDMATVGAGRRGVEVSMAPIASLKPYDNNAKLHTREQIEAVEASIRKFGFRNPVIACTTSRATLR